MMWWHIMMIWYLCNFSRQISNCPFLFLFWFSQIHLGGVASSTGTQRLSPINVGYKQHNNTSPKFPFDLWVAQFGITGWNCEGSSGGWWIHLRPSNGKVEIVGIKGRILAGILCVTGNALGYHRFLTKCQVPDHWLQFSWSFEGWLCECVFLAVEPFLDVYRYVKHKSKCTFWNICKYNCTTDFTNLNIWSSGQLQCGVHLVALAVWEVSRRGVIGLRRFLQSLGWKSYLFIGGSHPSSQFFFRKMDAFIYFWPELCQSIRFFSS